MNDDFTNYVLEIASDLKFAEPFFYRDPVDHILCGFCYYKSSFVAYVVGGAYPLYASTQIHGITLSYTERLEEITHIGLSEKQQAMEFVKIIRPLFSKIDLFSDLEYFTNYYLPDQLLCDRDVMRRYTYILNMIMLGNEFEAKKQLKLLMNSKYMKNNKEEQDNNYLNILSDVLSKGINVAKNKLLDWEDENRRLYNITHQR